jgi:HPt (histidine-containing phosphotransfer) domain-containing protein
MLSKKALTEYKKLKRSYHESLKTKRQNLEALWRTVDEGMGSETDLQNLRLFVHRLAGSAASYGYEIISNAAREAEQLSIESVQNHSTHSAVWPRNKTGLHSAVTRLISAIDTAIAQKDTG